MIALLLASFFLDQHEDRREQNLKVIVSKEENGATKLEFTVRIKACFEDDGKCNLSHSKIEMPKAVYYCGRPKVGYIVTNLNNRVFLESSPLTCLTGNVVFPEVDAEVLDLFGYRYLIRPRILEKIEKGYSYALVEIPFKIYTNSADVPDCELLSKAAPETGTIVAKMAFSKKRGSALFLAVIWGGFEAGPLWAKPALGRTMGLGRGHSQEMRVAS